LAGSFVTSFARIKTVPIPNSALKKTSQNTTNNATRVRVPDGNMATGRSAQVTVAWVSCRHLTRPNSSLECIGRSCGHWSAEAWSACDFKTCTVIRDVKCISERNISMTEVFCDSVSKPVYSQQCPDTKFCESYQKYLISNYNHSLLYMGVLSYTNWSACSAKCGRGNQSRDVLCLFASKHSIVLPISQCDTKSVESTFRECQIADCQFKLVKKWGKVRFNQ